MADGTSFYIPDDAISEDLGGMTCKITTGNLYDVSLSNVLLFTKRVGESMFSLYRDNQLNLIFKHLSTKTGIREAKINLGIFGSPQELFIALTWSEKEDYLYVGEPNNLESRTKGR